MSEWAELERSGAGEPLGVVVGVVGGCGGIGASRFAAVLAATAAARAGRCLLVDLDPAGGGLDAQVGAEAIAGPRWSQLRLAGGALDAEVLLSGLPRWGRTLLLAADGAGLPPPAGVGQVLDSARTQVPVVVDLARYPSPARSAAVAACTLVVMISGTDLPAIMSARTVRAGLAGEDDGQNDARVVVVARGPRSAGVRAAGLIGAPLAAALPERRGRDGAPLNPVRSPRAMRRVADGLLEGLTGLAELPRPSRHERRPSRSAPVVATVGTAATVGTVGAAAGWRP